MKKLIVFISFIFFNLCFSQDDCDCYRKYGVKVQVEPFDWCKHNEEQFKGMKAFFDCMCACQKNNQLLFNNSESIILEDKTHIFGDYRDSENLTLQYDGNITYKVNLQNGISITPKIENLSIVSINYQGKSIPNKILDSLKINYDDNGWINIKDGNINLKSAFKFYKGFDFNTIINNVDFQSINTLYSTASTSFTQQEINQILEKLYIKNPTEFYDLDVEALYEIITYFDVPILEKIKIAMDKNKSEAEILKKKQKEVKTLTPNNKLSLEQLKRKLQLLKDLVAGGIIHCTSFQSCDADIKAVEDEMLKRENASNIADIIAEINKLNPNSNLNIEQLNQKLKLLKDLKNLDECKTYKICDSEIKKVQDEIEKRFDVDSMTIEECKEWMRNFIKNNTNYNEIIFYRKYFIILTGKKYEFRRDGTVPVMADEGYVYWYSGNGGRKFDKKNKDEIIEFLNLNLLEYHGRNGYEDLNFLEMDKNQVNLEKIFKVLQRLINDYISN